MNIHNYKHNPLTKIYFQFDVMFDTFMREKLNSDSHIFKADSTEILNTAIITKNIGRVP